MGNFFDDIGDFIGDAVGIVANPTGGLINLAGSLLGGRETRKGISEATDAVSQANQAAIEALRRGKGLTQEQLQQQFDLSKSLYDPYAQARTVLPDMIAAAQAESPGYQRQRADYIRDLNAQMAARGIFNTGRGVETLSEGLIDLGQKEEAARFGRMGEVARLGTIGTAGMERAGQNLYGGLAGLESNLAAKEAGILSGQGGDLGSLALYGGQQQAQQIGNLTGQIGGLYGYNQAQQAYPYMGLQTAPVGGPASAQIGAGALLDQTYDYNNMFGDYDYSLPINQTYIQNQPTGSLYGLNL